MLAQKKGAAPTAPQVLHQAECYRRPVHMSMKLERERQIA